MKKYASWTNVRTLGELKILTKVSYFLLVFVPILASLWPIIIGLLYSSVISFGDIRESIEVASLDLEKKMIELDQKTPDTLTLDKTKLINSEKEIKEITNKLNENLGNYLNVLESSNFKNRLLPMIWVLGFLASLLVLFGQLIYQGNAPEIVKNFKKIDFVSKQKTEYVEQPTETMLKNGIQFLKNYAKKSKFDNLLSKYNVLENPEKRYLTLEERELFKKQRVEELRKVELDIIENWASETYDASARSQVVFSLLSMVFYYSAIGIILYITYSQTCRVFIAAGWL